MTCTSENIYRFYIGDWHPVFLGSADTLNGYNVETQIIPNEQRRWKDFSSGSEITSKLVGTGADIREEKTARR